MSNIVLTFSDIVSHGDNMLQIGSLSGTTFRNEDIIRMFSVVNHEYAELYNIKSVLPLCLHNIDDAYVLVIRKYFINECNELNTIFSNSEEVNKDGNFTGVLWDSWRVINGKMSENRLSYKLVFANLGSLYKVEQIDSRGTVYNQCRIPIINTLISKFETMLCGPLLIEADLYSNMKQPMMKERNRSKILKMCVGSSVNINFSWYKANKCLSDLLTIKLNNGDICIFSENAIGYCKDNKTGLHVKYNTEVSI